ncbi:MAG TPA: NAD(+)/NADH kinase [Baekduia sp.]
MSLDGRGRIERIGLVIHPSRPLDAPLEALATWAREHDTELVQVPARGQERVVAPPGDAATVDLVVSIGGDGTTLAALQAAAPHGKPVLGIACGSLGALTATSAADLPTALDRLAAGEWLAHELPGVGVGVDGRDPVVAINDVVVARKGANQVVVGIHVDGELYVRFAGDGVVIATPLGSSAYTMAAGGPILAQRTEAIVVTPVAPHAGSTPPLVVGVSSDVRITVDGGYGGARIELDGQVKDLEPHTLDTSWVEGFATLVRFAGTETLLAGLRRRQILTDSPRVVARDDREHRHPAQPQV